MEGNKVKGAFQFWGSLISVLAYLGSSFECCGPRILEGFIYFTFDMESCVLLYLCKRNGPLVFLSHNALQNFAEMTCEFHPKTVPWLLTGRGMPRNQTRVG